MISRETLQAACDPLLAGWTPSGVDWKGTFAFNQVVPEAPVQTSDAATPAALLTFDFSASTQGHLDSSAPPTGPGTLHVMIYVQVGAGSVAFSEIAAQLSSTLAGAALPGVAFAGDAAVTFGRGQYTSDGWAVVEYEFPLFLTGEF